MKLCIRKCLFLVFGLTIAFDGLHALGAADNVASFAVNHADDVARAVIINADDLVQAGLLHVDDVMRVGALHADDFARLTVLHADDFARLSLKTGDNIIYDFSKIHLRAHTLTTVVDSADDIALKGMPKAAFAGKYGDILSTDITAFTGKQYKKIQAVLKGEPVPTRGFINGKYLEGDEFIQALGSRANRINDFLNTQTISNGTKLLRGDNLPENALRQLYNIGDIKGKNVQEIADMIRTNRRTFNPSSLTSASLPNVNKSLIDEFALYGWEGTTGNFKIIRELQALPGTKGFNISQLSNVRGQQEFLMPKGLRTMVTHAMPDKVTMNGVTYDVIRVFETIIP
ncbi:MAG: hypothetical protein LBB22_01565 [Treponema sp.]|jgi:hypothetical protein|nr:hypothetical protein [Treponema sp.]